MTVFMVEDNRCASENMEEVSDTDDEGEEVVEGCTEEDC